VNAVIECITSAFGDEPSRILKIIQRFGKHCICHLQGEYVMVGRFWQPYIGQAVGGELDSMVLIGRAEAEVVQKTAQPLHIHPEDDNCNACQNG
jgi:hypothetical protein